MNKEQSVAKQDEKLHYNDEIKHQTKSLKKKLKKLSLEWISTSTSHGLPNIFRTKRLYLKFFWFICFLAATTICAFIIIASINSYLKWSVTVNTNVVTEIPLYFPAVTICNLNPFYKPRALKFFKDTILAYNLNFSLVLNELQKGQTAIGLTETLLDIFKSEAATNPDFNSTYRQQLGFNLDDMLISCSYGANICTANDFILLQNYDYGNCYTFNSGANSKVKTISSAGAMYGLQIELFSGDPNDELFIYKRGFYVVVHNQSNTPIMDSEGVYAGIGMETNIGIDRTFYFKQSHPYSDCIIDPASNLSSNSSIYQAMMNVLHEKAYRQKYCIKLCYQKAVIDRCSCYDPRYPNIFPRYQRKIIQSCRSSLNIDCLTDVQTEFDEIGVTSKCQQECPIECLVINNKAQVHVTTYPTNYYLNFLKLQTNLTRKYSNKTTLIEDIQNSVAKINIFYNEISYTALVETPTVTLNTLIGNIGGQLGLFIGISFLSLIEVVEFGFEILRTIYHHLVQNKVKIFSLH